MTIRSNIIKEQDIATAEMLNYGEEQPLRWIRRIKD